MDLLNLLIKNRWLKTPNITEAFKNIKRKDFLPEGMEGLAEVNEALPIGQGQTISQPLTVAFMTELLQPNLGDKILDVGYGSGWTTALLCDIVGSSGKVTAIEKNPELADFGKANINKYNFIKKGVAKCITADGSRGCEKDAPYDKILVSAAMDEILRTTPFKEQLKIGGRLVCPIKNSIWLFIKKENGYFHEKETPGFVFVPLTEDDKK